MNDGRQNLVLSAVENMLLYLGCDLSDPNLIGTPRRVSTWMLQLFPTEEERHKQFQALRGAVFPTPYRGMVSQTGITVSGACIHHLMPIDYCVSIGYLPDEKAIGLSKLARAAKLYLSPAGIQEDATRHLADGLVELLEVENVAVVVRGRHSCMVARGVEMPDSLTTTSEMRGAFLLDEGGCKSEFLQLVYSI
jgi:GTP cyclohydrolase I